MRDEEEQDYAFQYWFERGYPVKKIHSRLPGPKPTGIELAAEEELIELMSHNETKSSTKNAIPNG